MGQLRLQILTCNVKSDKIINQDFHVDRIIDFYNQYNRNSNITLLPVNMKTDTHCKI